MRTGAGFIPLALLCLLVSCLVCQTAEAGLFPERDTRIFTSRNYGISFEYPDNWTIESEKFIPTGPAGIDRQILRLRYENTTNGLVLAISVSREDIDPALLPSNFSGSEECGGGWTDDRPNLAVLEAYQPTSIGGVKARRFIFLLNEPENQTVETIYEVCTSYRSGRIMHSWFFWSIPSDEYFRVKPVVQDVLDSVRIFEPMGLVRTEGLSDRFIVDFPDNDEDIYDFFNSSGFGLSFQYPKGWRITSSLWDTENLSITKKGAITFSNLPEEITMQIDLVRYDIVDISQRNRSLWDEAALCTFECPECIPESYEAPRVSGEFELITTNVQEINNRTYVEELWLVCPVYKGMHELRYKIIYSVPSEKWQNVQPFMHNFISSIEICEPS